jgi:hypothetical protein
LKKQELYTEFWRENLLENDLRARKIRG